VDTAPADGVPDGSGSITPTQAECIATGVPAAAYPGFSQNNSQLQVFAFGNPNLSTETAETWTYGVVFQPDWFPVGDLRATVDYYDIEISDAILAVGTTFIFTDCYNNNNPASCARLNRNPADGQFQGIGFGVNTTVANQGSLVTSGFDIQAEWSVPIGPGQLTINELYSILDDFIVTTATGVFTFAGTTSGGIGGAFPDFKSTLSVTYAVGDWTLFGRWVYSPEVISGNGFGSTTDAFPSDPVVSPASSYVDLGARWSITDNFTITANIDNIFDEYPPQTADGYVGQGNVDVALYPDPLGRQFQLSGRYRF
jgi:outer membrane receptor protein involved in Fe transport